MRVVALTCGGGQVALARSLNEKFALSVLQPSGGESVLQGVYVFAKDKSIGVEKWLHRVDSVDPAPQQQQQQQQQSQAVAPGRYQVVLTKPKGKLIFPSGKETVAEVWVSVPRVEGDWAVHSLMYREAASAALMPSTPPTYVGTLLWHAARAIYVIERHQPSKAVPTLGLFGVESSPDGRSNTVSGCWTNLIYFVPEQARILGMERWARIPAMSLAQHPKTLCVHVSGARNLANAQTVGVSSPYFVMSLLRATDAGAPIELYTSGVIKHSLSPNFDYTYEVALKKLAKKVGAVPSTLAVGSGGIKLEILGHNRILKDDLLGELHLTWKQIDEAAAYGAHMDYPLRDGKGHASGTVNLLISFSGRGKQDKHASVPDSAVVPGQFHQ